MFKCHWGCFHSADAAITVIIKLFFLCRWKTHGWQTNVASHVLAMLVVQSHVRTTRATRNLCVNWTNMAISSANPQVSPTIIHVDYKLSWYRIIFCLCCFKPTVFDLSSLPEFDKCSISGDPHYRTFDGFTHHYQGPYTYILSQDHNLQDDMPSLLVRGKNIRRGGNKRVSFLDQVYIDVYGVNVRFLPKKVVLVSYYCCYWLQYLIGS